MVKIAILGFGTVGSGVAEVIEENADSIARRAANEIGVKYILKRKQLPDSPFADKIIHDFSIIEKDPEIQVMVECIGGLDAAYDYTKRCLMAGKSVVTSNKELVATKGHELIAIAKEKNVNYLFEASVGGGIPIIRPITQCLAANEIDEIYGILNGTTNYILTKMIQFGASFEQALKQARDNGFAEKDPTDDIEGHDSCRKICILSALCFGRHVYPHQVPTRGISGVTRSDVEYARHLGYKIKLLGRALRTGKDTITAYVAPHLINKTSLLSNVDGVMNGIVVHGNAIGEAIFYGAGAGKLPTASAVVADVIDAVKHFKARKYLDWEDSVPGYVTDSDELPSRWYVRTGASLEEIGRAFGNVKFISYPEADPGEYAFATREMTGHQLKSLINGMEVRSVFRILD
ncbi:MAG TPA: homoserine dehydrogenase [Clostridiales bacterium]|nr:homoserine dehydrogenase [Clostridiales bacterium]